ncbi:MAG: hypothetical protein ACI4GY_10640 [Acutalibacteraceae bacterium]
MMLRIQSLLIAIYLFFAGFIYGDAPRKMDFDCTVPSGVYEYEPGDKIQLHVKTENVGRPFKEVAFDSLDVYIYQEIDGKRVTPYDIGYQDELPCEWPEELIKNGYTYETTFTFTVSKNAPKGDYIISVSQFGESEEFEGLIKVI